MLSFPHVRWRVMRNLSLVVDLGRCLRRSTLTPEEGALFQHLADVGTVLMDADTDLDWPERGLGFVLFEDELELGDAFRRDWHALPSSPVTLLDSAARLSPQGARTVEAAGRLLARMAYNGLPERGGGQDERAFS